MGVLGCVVVLVSILTGILFTVMRLLYSLLPSSGSPGLVRLPAFVLLPLASQVALDITWLDHTGLLGFVHCCCVHIVVPYWLLGSIRCCCVCTVVPYQVAWFHVLLLGATFILRVDVPGVVRPYIVA